MDEPSNSLQHVGRGERLTKVRGSGQYPRTFALNQSRDAVTYRSKKISQKLCSGSSGSQMEVADIVEVRKGCRTDTLNDLQHKKPDLKEDCFFSIVHGRDNKTLDLMAPSLEARDHWVTSLTYLAARANTRDDVDARDRWLHEMFREANRNNDGVLSFGEVDDLLEDKLGVKMKKKHLKSMFNEAAATSSASQKGKQNVLDFKAFANLYRRVARRPEIEAVFNTYSNGDIFISPAKLQQFLVSEQKEENVTPQMCAELIRQYEPSRENHVQGQEKMGFDGFVRYLRSEASAMYNPEHRKLHQDMTRPLSEYFIASSHNTYLTEHQLKGPSSVESYIRAFEKGCRLVELDCFDGKNGGEPRITHGFTLTTDIRFRDVCEAIRDRGFKTSPYPILLSMENHLSVKQQAIAASIMKETLGDILYIDALPDGWNSLPSPEQLKYRVLIKDKKPKVAAADAEELDVSDDSEDEDREADMDEREAEVKQTGQSEGAEQSSEQKNDRHKRAYGKGGKKMSPEYVALINPLQKAHYKGCQHALDNYAPSGMSSIKEKKSAEEFMSDAMVLPYTNKFLIKIYPTGSRIWNSTNLAAYKYWPGGCQLVCLNYQYAGEQMQINDSFFEKNGNCGYVLKPDIIRAPDSTFRPMGPYPPNLKRTLTVKILSGQYIPLLGDKKDTVDPFVKLKLYGVEPDIQRFATQKVKNNGLNPVWNEEFTMDVQVPQVAFLRFVVRDDDKYSNDDFLGQCALPVSSLKLGYRHVPLKNKRGHSLAPASLFVHLSMTLSPRPRQSSHSVTMV